MNHFLRRRVIVLVLLGLLGGHAKLVSAGDDSSACIEPQPLYRQDREALRLGRQLFAVTEAVQNPSTPGALESILELGTDSRYYVMVRGWLAMQLQGDLSIIAASRADAPPDIAARAEFLQQAIRTIDLE